MWRTHTGQSNKGLPIDFRACGMTNTTFTMQVCPNRFHRNEETEREGRLKTLATKRTFYTEKSSTQASYYSTFPCVVSKSEPTLPNRALYLAPLFTENNFNNVTYYECSSFLLRALYHKADMVNKLNGIDFFPKWHFTKKKKITFQGFYCLISDTLWQ